MSGISPISSTTGSKLYGQIASGKRITSAADDASGLAISQKLEEQTTATDVNRQNDETAKNALNIADGALGGVSDYLQRIKELSVKAGNSFLTQDDKQAIQAEIDQALQGIDEIAKGTEFNTKKLLDGSSESMHIASNPDGSGMEVGASSSTVEALGLKGFNVTGKFDMKAIDDAIAMVSRNRSKVGAQTNALEYAASYSAMSSENLTGANSRLADLDIPKAISEMKKDDVVNNYRLMMQKKEEEEQKNSISRLFQGL